MFYLDRQDQTYTGISEQFKLDAKYIEVVQIKCYNKTKLSIFLPERSKMLSECHYYDSKDIEQLAKKMALQFASKLILCKQPGCP